MNIANFHYQNIDIFFKNIQSEKLGFYFSFGLHLFFLLFVIGFPNFFKSSPVNIPNVIPIEIINVSDQTSIPLEPVKKEFKKNKKKENTQEQIKQKKFNNIQQAKKKPIDIKTKPNKEPERIEAKVSENIKVKEKKIIEEDINKFDTANKDLRVQQEKIESLPTNKIKPKIKPKNVKIDTLIKDTDIEVKVKNIDTLKEDVDIEVNVKSKPKPTINIVESVLKDLRNEKTEMNKDRKKNETKKELSEDKKSDESKAQLSISEIDLLIQQLTSCWTKPAGAPPLLLKKAKVKISAKINSNRRVLNESLRIIDTNISKDNPFYGPITESAMRTFLNPECQPLKLPPDKYDLWKNLIINFDHGIMGDSQ